MTNDKKAIEAKFDSHISKFNAEKEEESEQKSQRIQELEVYVKSIEDENESLKNKYEKDQAISQQKIEFMQVQVEQEKNQREEVRRNYERMIKTFQAGSRESVIGKEEAQKHLESIKEKFQNDYRSLQESFEIKLDERDKEITQLTQKNQKLELGIQLSSQDFKKELALLKENLQATEEERDRLKDYAKNLDAQKAKVMEDFNKKYQVQVDELEREIEEKEREHEMTIEEIH